MVRVWTGEEEGSLFQEEHMIIGTPETLRRANKKKVDLCEIF